MQRLHKAFLKPFSSRVFTRTFLLFFLCFTLPVVVVSSAVLFRTGMNLRAEMITKTQQSFESSADALDNDLSILRNAVHQLSNTRWISKVLSAKGHNISEYMTPYDRHIALREVKMYMDMLGIADSMAICFPEQNAVFSNLWYDDFDTYFNTDTRLHGYSASDFRAMLSQNCKMTALPLTDAERLGHGREKYVTLMQTFSPNGGWEDGTVLFYLSENTLLSYFSDVLDKNAQLVIEGEDGLSLLHTPLPQGKCFTLTKNLFKTPWRVTVQVPYTASDTAYSVLTQYAVLVVLFIFIAGTLMSYYMARRDYRPVYEITQDIAQDDDGEETAQEDRRVDEFDVMRKNIDRMRSEIVLYKRRVGETFLLAKHRCVEQLLDTSDDQRENALRSLTTMGITLPYPCFRCVLVSCAEKIALSEDTDASFSADHFVTLTAMMGDSLVIVTNYAPQSDTWDAFSERLTRYMSEIGMDQMLTVVGTEKQSVHELSDSYQDALMALNTRILTEVGMQTTESAWIWAEEPSQEEESVRVRFDLRQEEALGNLLKAGDAQSALRMAKTIMEENGAISLTTLRTLFHLLTVLPFRILDESVTASCAEELRAIPHTDNIDAMLSRIEKLYQTVCENQLGTMQNYDDHLMTWIMQYVQENVFRQDISLKLLSDEFSLSVSQISRLFKKATGKGFSEWVNDRRIEEAKRLLRDRTASLSDIPARCGFTNNITFRRVFKKCTGMTPTEWRDMEMNEQENNQ